MLKVFEFFKSIFIKNKNPVVIYESIGGQERLQYLVDRFYYHMDTDPRVKECRDLHHENLSNANKKLFMFLSGWLGGPSLFIEAFGHPMMRKRHFPFKIGPRERDQWLFCMRRALDELELESNLDSELWQGFRKFAEHMRNSEE